LETLKLDFNFSDALISRVLTTTVADRWAADEVMQTRLVEIGAAQQHINADQEQNRHQVSTRSPEFPNCSNIGLENLFCTSNAPNEEGVEQSVINSLSFCIKIQESSSIYFVRDV